MGNMTNVKRIDNKRIDNLKLPRKIMAAVLLLFALGIALKQVGAAKNGYDYDLNPLFANVSGMTTQELIAEMKYAVKMRNEGKYYPQNRIEQIERQLADNQKVKFKMPEKLTVSIPSYSSSSGWTMFVEPGGKLEGGKYGYLFYEADVEEIYFQKSAAWKLPVEGRIQAFEAILDAYGFNSVEKHDFIEFWNAKIDAGKQYLVYPQETALVERAMPLVVTPEPDRIYRIWFYFVASGDEPACLPAAVERIGRSGFTVVEWGGMVK